MIYARNNPRHKRHYTVCNVLRPHFKKEIMTLMEKLIQDQPADFNLDLLSTTSEKNVYFSIKKYHNPEALSYKMHKIDCDRY